MNKKAENSLMIIFRIIYWIVCIFFLTTKALMIMSLVMAIFYLLGKKLAEKRDEQTKLE